jgi:2-oxoglutarate ferredoxin oxidoreductase subunit delta
VGIHETYRRSALAQAIWMVLARTWNLTIYDPTASGAHFHHPPIAAITAGSRVVHSPSFMPATPPSSPVCSTPERSATPEVIFAEDLCKGCELCVTICPTKILKLDITRVNLRGYHPAIVYNLMECSGCASCAKICPDSVITVRR